MATSWITTTRDTPMSAARVEDAIDRTSRNREEVEVLTHDMREALTSFRIELALTDRGITF
jgi:hypothetical protein